MVKLQYGIIHVWSCRSVFCRSCRFGIIDPIEIFLNFISWWGFVGLMSHHSFAVYCILPVRDRSEFLSQTGNCFCFYYPLFLLLFNISNVHNLLSAIRPQRSSHSHTHTHNFEQADLRQNGVCL